jgi:hypothetical protein
MKAGFALDMKGTGFGLIPLGYHASAVFADPKVDKLYLVLDDVSEPSDDGLPVPPDPPIPDGISIYEFNGGDAPMTYRWKSKLFVLAAPLAFLRVQVKAASFSNTVFRAYRQVQVGTAWVDTLLREVVVTSEAPFNLPMTEDYSRFWWEIISTDDIQGVQVAEDVSELT